MPFLGLALLSVCVYSAVALADLTENLTHVSPPAAVGVVCLVGIAGLVVLLFIAVVGAIVEGIIRGVKSLARGRRLPGA
jgi:L-cystine uptake protein TcyP (sodium:dicarboxylate symporter family)